MTRPLRVCLAWHNFDSSNYGVGALSIAHLELIQRAATELGIEIVFSTVGSRPQQGLQVRQQTEQIIGQPIEHTNFSLRQTVKRFLKFNFSDLDLFAPYDIVFDIGEGDSFADIYGKKRFFAHWLAKRLVLRKKIPLVICPQTIGPFESRLVARLASNVMRRAALVYARDDISAKFANDLGVETSTSTDVAFALGYNAGDVITDSVGINVSGLMLSGGYTQSNQFGITVDYRALCEDMVRQFRARNKTVFLTGHVISESDPIEDDFRACQSIKATFKDDDHVRVADRFDSPVAAKSFISRLEFFVGSRMHATIASFSSGVVTVPLAYSRKFEGVFGTLQYPYTLDARRLNNEQALQQIFDLFDNHRAEMAEILRKCNDDAQQRNDQYVSAIKRVLASV